MLKVKIQSGGKKILYKSFSVAVKYLIDSKKLEADFMNLEKIFNVRFSELQKKNFLSDKKYTVRAVNSSGKPDELIIFKVKLDEKFSSDYFRNQLTGFISSFENEEIKSLHIFIPDFEIFRNYFKSPEYYYQTFVEGIYYGSYSFNAYKSEGKKRKDLNVFLYAKNEKKLNASITNGNIIMDGVFFARDLQNEPSNNLTPQIFSERVKAKISNNNTSVTVLNEKVLRKMKMEGILAVGKGSVNPPALVVIRYSPPSEKKQKLKTSVLVGKGVMFDSGGISIKPAQSMWEMKADMSGAAVVAAIIYSAGKAKLKVNIIGVITAAETQISGASYKTSD
ncbi:MAG: leucyl aminopeptidase, partial [Ignavibacteriales bacterium]